MHPPRSSLVEGRVQVPFSDRELRILRRFLDAVDVGVAHVTAKGDVLYANPRFLELIGDKSLRRHNRSNLKQFMTNASWPALEAALRNGMYTPTEGNVTIEAAGMPSRIVHLSFSPLRFPRGTSVFITAVATSELTRSQKELQESRKSLELLSSRILRLQDEERRRIARDLHDVIGQEVAVVSVTLDRVKKAVGDSGSNVRQMVDESVHLLTKIQEEIRSLSYLLHPPMLDELGIASAVGMYVEGFEKRSGIQVSFEVTEDFPRLPSEQEIALFRVVQESLTNVLRHSGGKSVQVSLRAEDGRVKVKVRDNGLGMPSDVLLKLKEKKIQVGVGISGLRERLKALGGTLEIRSRLPGTEICAILPLDGEGQTESIIQEPLPRSTAQRNRVLIADDYEITRNGVKALLCSQPDIEVCGEAADGLDAVRLTEQLSPDLVILDTSMPRAGGFYAAHMIREAGIKCKIVIFADYSFPAFEKTLRNIHCNGYVLKSHMTSELLRAIRAVLAGQEFFPSSEKAARGKLPSAASLQSFHEKANPCQEFFLFFPRLF